MSDLSLVSIIIPCRNEDKFIGACLDSVIVNDYPKGELEVLVVDGMSEDGTRDVVERYVKEFSFIKLLNNPKKIIPAAMNIGIKNAKGDIIMKIDAHSAYERDYISKCVKYLCEYNADNVGGIWKMVPRDNTLLGKSIVLALSNPFGAGNAYFRIGSKEPRWVDTAPFGCYRKNVFDRIGLYDENIARSEDVAINSKLRRSGGKILLVPEIVIYYYTRSKFSEFCKHNFDNGLWTILPFKFTTIIPVSLRHLAPLAFVSSLMGLLGLWGLSSLFGSSGLLSSLGLLSFLVIVGSYFLCSFFFSTKIALKEKDIRYLFIIPVIFASLHISYGLGSLVGLAKVISSKLSGTMRPEERG